MSWLLILITVPASAPNQVTVRAGLTTGVSLKLSAGWTWFSLNVENADMSIGQVLGSLTPAEGDYIKNQTVSSTYYEGYGWFGELLEIDPCETYKIKLAESDSLMIEGLPADPQSHPITIKAGWNWIGYLPQSAQPLSEALACINPVSDDYLKNQTTSSTWYDGYGWFGELSEMAPLDGYMLKTSHAGTLIFTGPSSCSFIDARDGKTYSCVEIGTQTWMAENLAWLPEVSTSASSSATSPYYYVYGYEGTDVNQAKATANYLNYGVLYNWSAAMDGAASSESIPSGVRGACPTGWHLPSLYEWSTLTGYLTTNGYGFGGSGSDIGKSLASSSGWYANSEIGTVGNDQSSNNATRFSALPAGIQIAGVDLDFIDLGRVTYFWSSTLNGSFAWINALEYYSNSVHGGGLNREYGASIRCLKNVADYVKLPTVTTLDITNITIGSATCSGNVVNDGGAVVTDRGIYRMIGAGDSYTSRLTHDGSGTGSFSNNLTGLAAGTTYRIWTYATNYVGSAWGETKEFTTLNNQTGNFIDSRDDRQYKWVKIGSQTWMAENLAYLPSVSPSSGGSAILPYYYVYNYQGTNVAEAKTKIPYTTYGVLYNWPAAMNGEGSSTEVPSGVRGACPAGWHLPSDGEWTVLTSYLISNEYGFGGLGDEIAKSMAHNLLWSENYLDGSIGKDMSTNNSSGFTALPGGLVYSSFDMLGQRAFFWSSTSSSATHSWMRNLAFYSGYMTRQAGSVSQGYSVRCLKNETSSNQVPTASFTIDPAEGCVSTNFQFDASGSTDAETSLNDLQMRWDWTSDGTWDTEYSTAKTASHQYLTAGTYSATMEVKDADGLTDTETKTVTVTNCICGEPFSDSRDGRTYSTVKIGNQCWMAENLAWLPEVSPPAEGSGNSPYYYVYEYEGTSVSEAKAQEKYVTYGALYNWDAARTACPAGWNLPGDEDLKTLEKYLGMSQSDADKTGWRYSGAVGGKLKETGTSHWASESPGATNASGFTALGGGFRHFTGEFDYLGLEACFWSSSESETSNAWARILGHNDDGSGRAGLDRGWGFSVRCVRDSNAVALNPNAVIIDSASTRLLSDSVQLSQGIYGFQFSGTPPELAVGKIIAGPAGQGYLRRITGIINPGNPLILQTEPATMEDLFNTVNIGFQSGISPAVGSSGTAKSKPENISVNYLADGVKLTVGMVLCLISQTRKYSGTKILLLPSPKGRLHSMLLLMATLESIHPR